MTPAVPTRARTGSAACGPARTGPRGSEGEATPIRRKPATEGTAARGPSPGPRGQTGSAQPLRAPGPRRRASHRWMAAYRDVHSREDEVEPPATTSSREAKSSGARTGSRRTRDQGEVQMLRCAVPGDAGPRGKAAPYWTKVDATSMATSARTKAGAAGARAAATSAMAAATDPAAMTRPRRSGRASAPSKGRPAARAQARPTGAEHPLGRPPMSPPSQGQGCRSCSRGSRSRRIWLTPRAAISAQVPRMLLTATTRSGATPEGDERRAGRAGEDEADPHVLPR